MAKVPDTFLGVVPKGRPLAVGAVLAFLGCNRPEDAREHPSSGCVEIQFASLHCDDVELVILGHVHQSDEIAKLPIEPVCVPDDDGIHGALLDQREQLLEVGSELPGCGGDVVIAQLEIHSRVTILCELAALFELAHYSSLQPGLVPRLARIDRRAHLTSLFMIPPCGCTRERRD